jgi:dolichol kinase
MEFNVRAYNKVVRAVLLDRAKSLIDLLFYSLIVYILILNLITYCNILNAWGMPQELQGGRNGIDHNPICSLGVPQCVPSPFFSYLAGLALIIYVIFVWRLLAPPVKRSDDWYSRLIERLKSMIGIYFGGHLFLVSCLFFSNTSIRAVMSFQLSDGSFHLKPVKLVGPAEYFYWVPPERLPFLSLIAFIFLFLLVYFVTKKGGGKES